MTASPGGPRRRRVVLCADDFGLTEGVSRGILELADMGRVSATSVMANCRWWSEMGPDLRGFSKPIGVGLHLNLTTGRPLGPMPGLAPDGALPRLGTLLGRAVAGALAKDEIAAELRRQLDAFERVLGRAPDFVDGHQHVHVLPRVREALFAVLEERRPGPDFWMRDPSDRVASILGRRLCVGKAGIVRMLALGFRRAAKARGFATNAGFSGFSDFDPDADPGRLFEAALSRLGERPVAMCHPGRADDELRALDPAVGSRVRELDYLRSDRFRALLEERGIELAPAPG